VKWHGTDSNSALCLMIIFIHWSDKKPVANKRKKRKENLTNLNKEKRTVLMTLSHTSHNIIITQYKSSFIMKIEKQKMT